METTRKPRAVLRAVATIVTVAALAFTGERVAELDERFDALK
jgi:hypothetical protein